MIRRLFLTAILLFITGCATVPIIGPGGVEYALKTNETLHIRLPVPQDWEAEFIQKQPSLYMVTSPSKTVDLMITLDPMAVDTSAILNDINQYFVHYGDELSRENLSGSISGNKATGLRLKLNDGEVVLFAVDHDWGAYMVGIVIRPGTTDAEREAVQFMFERIQILDE